MIVEDLSVGDIVDAPCGRCIVTEIRVDCPSGSPYSGRITLEPIDLYNNRTSIIGFVDGFNVVKEHSNEIKDEISRGIRDEFIKLLE